jgi:hypothetical protein
MNRAETEALLRLRRDLTGETFNDGTVNAWGQALDGWSYAQTSTAVTVASRLHGRVNVSHVVEQLPAHERQQARDQHSTSCICAGRGWLDVTPDDAGPFVIATWARCPNGPPSGFYELDER